MALYLETDRPLGPQLKDAFNVRKHGTTIPTVLWEIACRIDALEQEVLKLQQHLSPTEQESSKGRRW